MNVEFDSIEEIQTKNVDAQGRVYLGKEYADKKVVIGFEVVDDDDDPEGQLADSLGADDGE